VSAAVIFKGIFKLKIIITIDKTGGAALHVNLHALSRAFSFPLFSESRLEIKFLKFLFRYFRVDIRRADSPLRARNGRKLREKRKDISLKLHHTMSNDEG